MDYLLVVVTHGESEPLRETLESFRRSVSPRPKRCLLVYDGDDPTSSRQVCIETLWDASWGVLTVGGGGQGFCVATAAGWRQAAESGSEFVFWLEHDFTFDRQVPLGPVSQVLSVSPHLAQISLMRNAVNAQERAAGGLYESRRDQHESFQSGAWHWLEHAAYFTTNPSLMRRRFMADNPWPDYPEQCEGRFGIDLVAQGYRFGVWGGGEPWVTHIGERNGKGY